MLSGNLGLTTTLVKLKYMVWLLFKKHIVSLGETGPIHMVQLSAKRGGRVVGAEYCGKVKCECGLKGKTLQ